MYADSTRRPLTLTFSLEQVDALPRRMHVLQGTFLSHFTLRLEQSRHDLGALWVDRVSSDIFRKGRNVCEKSHSLTSRSANTVLASSHTGNVPVFFAFLWRSISKVLTHAKTPQFV